MTSNLTPTQELLLEVAIARARLGHSWWTYTSVPSVRRAANELERKGYLTLMHGIVERTFRASLTDKAVSDFFLGSYVPPILGGPN